MKTDITLRDYFAGQALTGLLGKCAGEILSKDNKYTKEPDISWLAQRAYVVALAMLDERAKHEVPKPKQDECHQMDCLECEEDYRTRLPRQDDEPRELLMNLMDNIIEESRTASPRVVELTVEFDAFDTAKRWYERQKGEGE